MRRWLFVALWGWLGPACTLIANREATQCEADSDCLALGSEFAGTVCRDHVCASPPKECENSGQCLEKSGGEPAICRSDGKCANLLSEDCQEIEGNYSADGAVVFGFMSSTQGSFATIGKPLRQSASLAIREFDQIALGLPGGPDGRPRPLAFIACDDSVAPDRAARHLSNELLLPAIIGPTTSDSALLVAKTVTISSGVLLLSASATTPAIADLADNGLVWRTVPSDSLQASALTGLVTDLESEIRSEQGLAATDAVRVAIISKGDAFGTGLSDAVLGSLTFNGKGAVDNGKNFLQKVYPDTADEQFDFSSIVSEVTTFAPHIVLLLGTQELVDGVLAKLEASWPASTPRPRHLLTAWGRAPQTLALIGANEELRKRILGTAPGRRTKNFDAFALRYSGVFGSPPDTFATANAYDAVYVLAYGMTAAGAELTGKAIAEGMGHELGGEPIDVGPNRINAALSLLGSAGKIDLTGASGALDFNLQTGDAPSEIDVWCVTRNQDLQPIFQSTGRYLDPVTQKLVGNVSCP